MSDTTKVSDLERLARERDEWKARAAETSKAALLNGVRAEKAEAALKAAREALKEAREDVEHWGAYAGDYFQDKHDLAGDLARIDAAIATIDAVIGK